MVVLTACAVFVALLAPSVLAQTAEILKPAHFPYLGNRVAVWSVAQLHILFAGFILGAPIFVVISEWLGMRHHDPKYDRLAKEVTKVTAILYSMTALTGGFFLLALITLPLVGDAITGALGAVVSVLATTRWVMFPMPS